MRSLILNSRRTSLKLALLLPLLLLARSRAADPAPSTDPPGLKDTQVGIVLDDDRGEVQFRATVIGRSENGLLLLTAAHCVKPDDAGRTARVNRGDASALAQVVSVLRNPSYREGPHLDIPGADNALVRLRLDPDDPRCGTLLRCVRPAQVTSKPIPHPDGQTIPIYTIDKTEVPHVVRAGNYSNPKWLEWGPAFKPIPGDSGSGVFVYRRTPDNQPEPILIGVLTDASARGGGASLICLQHAWIARATRPAPSVNEK